MEKYKMAINALIMDEKKAGIGSYVFELLNEIKNIPIDFSIDVHIQQHMKQYFDDTPNITFVSHGDFSSSKRRILYEQLRMPHVYNNEGYALVHFVDYLSPALPIRAKRLFTLHDLSFFKLPECFTAGSRHIKQFFTDWGVKRASGIICVSQNTKDDLLDRYPFIKEKDVYVINLGVNRNIKFTKDDKKKKNILHKFGIDDRFILYVGTLEPRKNVERIVKAYGIAVRQGGIPQKLVLCGKEGWKAEGIFKAIEDSGLGDRIIITGYVSDDELPYFYNAADMFVYPSIYEGFGLPPLEAMSFGVPTITSNTSSLPEVVGDGAITVNPYDEGEIALAITDVLKDPHKASMLAEKGKGRAAGFSWYTTANETVEIYKKILMEDNYS
jgi:glycosyltransferase involved in cell wall biosynthesis